jgi:hypothetical protein
MAANTSQIFSRVGQINWAQSITSANTATDGTGTVSTIFTADASNGGRVEMVRARALGTNVATVLRIFVNNGSTNATAANNTLWAEITLPATTASNAAALADQYIGTPFFPLVLPPGYKLNATIGTAVSAGYSVTAAGGAY